MADTTRFRFDGGALWLNLLATQGQSFGPRPIERLPTTAAAAHWLTLAGFPPRTPVTDPELARLIEMREALRELAAAAVAGRDPAAAVLAHIHQVAESGSVALLPAMAREGNFTVDAVLATLALQALVTTRSPDRAYLKECGETDCRWVFLDTSGRRHWCPSPACASRGRVRAHRARQALEP